MINTDKILAALEARIAGIRRNHGRPAGAVEAAQRESGARELAGGPHPMNDFFDDGHLDTHPWANGG